MSISFFDTIKEILEQSGFAALTIQQFIMICIACFLIYLAIKKGFEPLLLLPIAFGMLLVNLPLTGLMEGPLGDQPGGLLYYLYQGVKLGIYPSLIFLGIGTMTDFGPLIARHLKFIFRCCSTIRYSNCLYSCYSFRIFTTRCSFYRYYRWR